MHKHGLKRSMLTGMLTEAHFWNTFIAKAVTCCLSKEKRQQKHCGIWCYYIPKNQGFHLENIPEFGSWNAIKPLSRWFIVIAMVMPQAYMNNRYPIPISIQYIGCHKMVMYGLSWIRWFVLHHFITDVHYDVTISNSTVVSRYSWIGWYRCTRNFRYSTVHFNYSFNEAQQ